MKKQTLTGLMLAASLFLCAFSTFRGEQGTGAANVVSSVTPVDTTRGGTIWTHSFSTGGTSYNSIPILGETAIYLVNGGILYELAYEDGRILRKLPLCAKMNSVCNMLLHDHDLYIPLSGGKMECVDITSMTSRWQSESFGGQSLSTVFYHKGYLYAGSTTINAQGTAGTFYCLDASDGTTKWTYEDNDHTGGYYWSGGLVHDDALYFTGDNGILVSHSLLEDKVYDRFTLSETAKIRAGLTYCAETDALYTVSTDGVLYEIKSENQKIKTVNKASIMPGAGQIYTTSTPTLYNHRIYVGCIADQTGCVAVMNTDGLQPVYQVKGPHLAEVKSSPLVSTRGDLSGTVTVYFSANAQPGGLYYFTDHPEATKASWQTLFIPASARQFCLSSIAAGTDGTLYYSNDSGTLFAVREVDESSDRIVLPSPTATPIPSPTATPEKTAPPVTKRVVKKPKKPGSIKIVRKKKKIVLRWKKKTKDSQTILTYRYGAGKWKKKILKKKCMCSFPIQKKKKLRIRLRSRIKSNGVWIYSGYTKTFPFKC